MGFVLDYITFSALHLESLLMCFYVCVCVCVVGMVVEEAEVARGIIPSLLKGVCNIFFISPYNIALLLHSCCLSPSFLPPLLPGTVVSWRKESWPNPNQRRRKRIWTPSTPGQVTPSLCPAISVS